MKRRERIKDNRMVKIFFGGLGRLSFSDQARTKAVVLAVMAKYFEKLAALTKIDKKATA
ncbi:MAG: hypothetical protein WC686_03440 [Candidatus Shapirobacteria bacterium]|jgi:hypothetical protein